jgi:hypothetical protein
MILSVFFAADFLGIGSDPRDLMRQARTSAAESLAVQLSVYASIGDNQSIDRTLSRFVSQSDDVLAASLNHADGSVIASHGEQDALNENYIFTTLTHLNFPILSRKKIA